MPGQNENKMGRSTPREGGSGDLESSDQAPSLATASATAEDRIALRDLLIWFGGALLGGIGGFQLGALLEANLIRLAAGVIGWLGGGLLGILLLSWIGRISQGKKQTWLRPGPTLPVRTASLMIIGFLVGCLIGGLVGSILLDRLAGPQGERPWSEGTATLLGGLLGFVLGGLLAPWVPQRPRSSGDAPST
jgi:uncharacterized membrane protein YfcA